MTVTSVLEAARTAFEEGNYAEAVYRYEQVITERPDLADIYQFNLRYARARSANVDSDKGKKEDGIQLDRPSVTTLKELYRQVDIAAYTLPITDPAKAPLVSVLMTAHNVAAYIEDAIISIFRQSWPCLEVVVVDDASTDATWLVLQRLSEQDDRLRCLRLNTNLGTYFAKNLALRESSGKYIFFQDGDDLSHPERISLGMAHLLRPGVFAVRGAYSRISFPNEEVLPVNGLISKLGLITIGAPRSAFRETGYFNCTMKASDEEWFERLRRVASSKGLVVAEVSAPTYYNTLRPGSLFADMISNDPVVDGAIEQNLSPERSTYAAAFKEKHQELGIEELASYFRFPVVRDLIPVSSGMSQLPNPSCPVVVSLCSVPEREQLLFRTLESLAGQVDEIHIYLDRYQETPGFVRTCHANVHVVRSAEQPGLRDNGKFLPLTNNLGECYFFTVDDDIIYPPDYVAALISRIEYYGRKAVIGVHGVLLPEQAQRYYSGFRRVFSFKRALERDTLVNNLGTGTAGCHTSVLRGLGLEHFPTAGMADLHFSAFCKQQGIPMIALARHANWLSEQETQNMSIYQEFSNADQAQSSLITEHRPWGYAAIGQAINTVDASTEVTERLQSLMPILAASMR
ncbi:MAG: glycosyltransferase [Chromatiaceae bacterium]|nr:glycosyltransferase [Chromatiaceae bacterium]